MTATGIQLRYITLLAHKHNIEPDVLFKQIVDAGIYHVENQLFTDIQQAIAGNNRPFSDKLVAEIKANEQLHKLSDKRMQELEETRMFIKIS